MVTRRFVALGSVAVAVGAVACAGASSAIGSSDEPYTSVANGLWVLEGTPEHGDMELLQLATKTYASIVHEVAPAEPDETADAGEPDGSPPRSDGPGRTSPGPATDTRRVAVGDVTRGAAARRPGESAPTATLSIAAHDAEYTITETGDALTLTKPDGRVLAYRRSYQVYCVPTDRSLEATVILELEKEPKLVGVNGDGRVFPNAGTYAAFVRTDVLFRLHEYEIVSDIDGTSVTVKLPWTEMSESEFEGTLALVGAPDALPPTPITCERIFPHEY